MSQPTPGPTGTSAAPTPAAATATLTLTEMAWLFATATVCNGMAVMFIPAGFLGLGNQSLPFSFAVWTICFGFAALPIGLRAAYRLLKNPAVTPRNPR